MALYNVQHAQQKGYSICEGIFQPASRSFCQTFRSAFAAENHTFAGHKIDIFRRMETILQPQKSQWRKPSPKSEERDVISNSDRAVDLL